MRALLRLAPDTLGELGDRDRARVPVAVLAHGDRAALGLAIADDQHVGHLAHFAVADLAPDRLRAIVELGAHAGLAQLVAHARRRLVVAVRARPHQPPGPRPAPPPPPPPVLQEGADETRPPAPPRPAGYHPGGLRPVG